MVSRVDAVARAALVVDLPGPSFTRPTISEMMVARLHASL
jgi:hypothetical protein